MAAHQEMGEGDPSFHDTGEFLAVSGGDGDYTGVRMTHGSPAASSSAEVEPVPEGGDSPESDSHIPEGGQFPSRTSAWGD